MAEVVTKTYLETKKIINQCDIFQDVEFIEYVAGKSTTNIINKCLN